jgi:hypothetical protein
MGNIGHYVRRKDTIQHECVLFLNKGKCNGDGETRNHAKY